jgi:putative copper resistance protein D
VSDGRSRVPVGPVVVVARLSGVVLRQIGAADGHDHDAEEQDRRDERERAHEMQGEQPVVQSHRPRYRNWVAGFPGRGRGGGDSLLVVLTVLRIVHLLSAMIWVGGTIALVFVGVPAIRRLEGEARATAMRALGRRWRPLGWSAMGIAILSGLWLTDLHGGLDSGAFSTDFDRTLILKSVLVAFLVVGALIHDYVLGPRLQRELRAGDERAPATRRRLVWIGWFNFSLTIAVPVLGAVVLTYLD